MLCFFWLVFQVNLNAIMARHDKLMYYGVNWFYRLQVLAGLVLCDPLVDISKLSEFNNNCA